MAPGDKAVYIGTVQYFRDEFFDTTKVVVKDNYAKANAEFRQKFGQQFRCARRWRLQSRCRDERTLGR